MGGSGPWSVIGAIATAFRFIKWLDEQDRPTVVIDDVKPGEALVVSHIEAEPSRRQRRKQARAAKKNNRKAARKAAKAAEKAARKTDESYRAACNFPGYIAIKT